MHYRDVLKSCASILSDRNQKYGDSDVCFERIAKIASVVLDKPVSEYDVAIILSCVKLGRIPGNPAYADNYVDLANYAAFSAHFASKEKSADSVVRPSFAKPASLRDGFYSPRPLPMSLEDFLTAINTVEEDIVEKVPSPEARD